MTKRDFFETVIAVVNGDVELTDEIKEQLVTVAESSIETLEKRKSSVSDKRKAKSSETTKKVLGIVPIYGEPATLDELVAKFEEVYEETITAQKIAANLKDFVKDGTVVKSKNKDKRVVYSIGEKGDTAEENDVVEEAETTEE